MENSRLTVVRTAVAALVISASSLMAQNAADTGFKHPVMRVPKLSAPPTLDGKINADEWGFASAFTGVTAEGCVGGHGSMVPEVQQVQWFLGYDDKYLYLAMRSPHPKGTYPVARVKEDDLVIGHPAVLFEDHVEVQILTHGRRDLATTQGHGFYKIMANAKGAVVDEFHYNGTDGSELLWSMGGPVKCSVTPEMWELEMAVELGRMNIKSLDGRSLVIQLVRTDSCTGMYFAGWVGDAWLAWNRFAEVDFAADSPAFRFLKLGEIGAGELDAEVELAGCKEAAEVNVEVLVEDADGKGIFADSKQISLKPGAKEKINFKKSGLPISKVPVADKNRRNHFEIKATAKMGKETVVLYHNRSPFMQVDAEFREKFLDKWIAGRPQSGEWEYKVAYLPYSNRLEASVDLDFFGMPESVLAAKSYRVSVFAKGDGKALAEGGGELVNLAGGPLLLEIPALKDGNYTARFELLDAAGKRISVKEADFVRKKYPWEGNKLGVSDEVIPPFTPMGVKDKAVSMWGRTYEIGGNGLPRQIGVVAPSGNLGCDRQANLLAAPIRIEVVRDGKAEAAADGDSQINGAAMHRVDLAGSSQAGELKAELKAFIEYDGWFETELKIGGGKADAVDLVADLDDQPGLPIDTIYVQRLGDGRNGNRFDEIPENPGVHFKSTDMLKVKGSKFDWKSFVPRTFVGNGDRGLWFFAWSAKGWELKDEQPAVQVERLKDGNVRLRVRLLAGPVSLEQPRTLRFAIQAAPVKPNHPRYRSFGEEGHIVHDTRGYRYYGISVDDFVNTRDDDYDELRKFVLYGMRCQGEEQKKAPGNYGWWHEEYMKGLANGARLTMYGSGQLTGMGPEEFKTFGGEWVGMSNWRPNRSAASDLGRFNYQGTARWTSDEQVSVTGINWTRSFTDFFLWYHRPLMEKSGFNGTWWDNSSIGLVREYDPDTGRIEESWKDYPRRHLMKRLNVLGWQLMRPPMWMGNMHADLAWNQVFWMVENDWYADGVDMTSLDQWTLGEFRAMARTKSTMQVAQPWLRGFSGTTPDMARKVGRSVTAMLLSHDIHSDVLGQYASQKDDFLPLRRTFASLRGLVNMTDTNRCLFAGYWRSSGMVQPSGKGVKASVYTNPNLRTAAVILFNTEKADQYLAGTAFDINALIPVPGRKLLASRIFDVEDGKDIATVFEDGKYVVKEPLLVGGREYRLIGVMAE